MYLVKCERRAAAYAVMYNVIGTGEPEKRRTNCFYEAFTVEAEE